MNAIAILITVLGLVISYLWWQHAGKIEDGADLTLERARKWSNPSGLDLIKGINNNAPQLYLNSPVLNPRIVEVTDGVHVAIEYAMGNSIFLEGPEGVIVVDTTESIDAASMMLKDYRKISSKPIVAVIYTHHHDDHTRGTPAFMEDPTRLVEIWAHKKFQQERNNINLNFQRFTKGAVHQLGLALAKHVGADSSEVNPRWLKNNLENLRQIPQINRHVEQDIEHVTIAGLNVTLIYQPGETEDHIAVSLPDKRVLMPGDNFYHDFPNLSAIRGVAPRSARRWFESLMKLRNLKAEYMVPSHGRPVTGEQEVYDQLSFYASAIRFVHDQTVRLMNQGLHPDEVASRIKLPASITKYPYLREEYGVIAWSSKGVFQQQVGWFNGDPVDLFPHTPSERARRMIDMVGEKNLLRHSEEALRQDDPQWALELSSYVLKYNPNSAHAKDVRTEALRALAGRQTNRVARNYYLTAALDAHQLIDWKEVIGDGLVNVDVSTLFNIMTVSLNAEAVDGINVTILLRLTDTKKMYRLQLVYSVLNVELLSEDEASTLGGSWDVKATGSSELVKKILIRKCSPFSTCEDERLKIEGSPEMLRQFLGYFDL